MFLRVVLCTIALAPMASAQTSNSFLNKVLGMAEPAEPSKLTHSERLQEYVLDTVGPATLVGEAASAGLGQWRNSPPEWGQGWGAYGKRFANNLGYNAVRQTITYGLSEPLDEDNRYFASRQQGFWPRTRHALVSTFTARHSDGSTSFSYSNTAGVVGASAISTLWAPPSWKGAGNIAENVGISFAAQAGVNLFREFLPELLHRPRK